ncbi:MAG: type I 3-dehydroquinate dehydratase [Patescibacteria group bacterium]
MKICIPIVAKCRLEAEKLIRRAQPGADLLEIWLDNLNQADVLPLISTLKKPVIAVCRGKEERGSYMGTEETRVGILCEAVRSGSKYVDIGLQTASDLIKRIKKVAKKEGAQLIISKHFWDSTPDLDELIEISKKAKHLGADIVKVAAQVNKWSDNVLLFEFTKRLASRDKMIVIGMGERGQISRIGCPLLGSFLTYVALDEKNKTASGQFTLGEFEKMLYFVR